MKTFQLFILFAALAALLFWYYKVSKTVKALENSSEPSDSKIPANKPSVIQIDSSNPLVCMTRHSFRDDFPFVKCHCTLQDSKGKLHELIIKVAFDFDDYSGGDDVENIRPYVRSYESTDGLIIDQDNLDLINHYLGLEVNREAIATFSSACSEFVW